MAASWPENIFNFLAQGEHRAAGVALSNGQKAPWQLAADGSLLVSVVDAAAAVAHTFVDFPEADEELLIKDGPGTLFEFSGMNESSTGTWVMLFDATELPDNGEAPLAKGWVEGNTPFSFTFGSGRPFSDGIFATGSSTAGSLTTYEGIAISGNAEIL